MEIILQLLKDINIAQLAAIGLMLWYGFNRLDKKIEKNKNELKLELSTLNNKVEDVDRRLCRIEGSLSTHGHCLFSQREQKLAE